MCISSVGYPSQLPPVQVESLWVQFLPSFNIDDKNSWYTYNHFNDAFALKGNNLLDEINTDGVQFNNILELARKDKMTEAGKETLISKYSMYKMSMSEFQSSGFYNDGVSFVFSVLIRVLRIITSFNFLRYKKRIGL